MKTIAVLLALSAMGMAPCLPSHAGPSAVPSSLQKAIALRDAGHIPEAVAEFAKNGVRLAPDGIQMFYSEYATRQWNAGHRDTAVKAYQDGIKAAPQGVGAGLMHYDLASLYYNKARYVEAIPEFRAATRFADRNNAWTWLLLGTSLRKTGQTAAARRAWVQASRSTDHAHTGAPQMARQEIKHLDTRSRL